jgi:hypothetical protein
MAQAMSNKAMADSMSDQSMADSMSDQSMAQTVAGHQAVSEAVSGQELRGGRGGRQQAGDASNGLESWVSLKSQYNYFSHLHGVLGWRMRTDWWLFLARGHLLY